MAKLLGIREQVGQLPGFVQRAQNVSLMGAYERAGSIERQYDPYEVNGVRRALGAEYSTYDLNAPGAVAEIKRVIKAYGRHLSDPFKQKNPIIDRSWERISIDDTWDGPTADAFTLMIGRVNHLDWVTPPWVFDAPSGPQPTAHGLELLAGIVNKYLGGSPQMQKYLAWRGGYFDPPSEVSSPPASVPVKATTNYGPDFRQLPADLTGIDQALIDGIAKADQSMLTMWQAALNAEHELQRPFIAASLQISRLTRNELMKEALSQSVIAKQCENKDWVWVKSTASCEEPPTVYQPPPKPPKGDDKAKPGGPPPEPASIGVGLVVIGVIGALGWYLTRPQETGVGKVYR